MKTIKHSRPGNWVSATILAAVLGMPVAVGALALVATPAYAQTTLTGAQISAIQTSLTAALQAAHGHAVPTENAISQAVVDAIVQYGCDTATSITSAIMSMAERAGVPADVIGRALARAAAVISKTSCTTAAFSIASTVANEGKPDEIVAFQAMAISLGYANLAALAGAGVAPVGETGGGVGGGVGGGGFVGGGGVGGGGGCLNPSCTAP